MKGCVFFIVMLVLAALNLRAQQDPQVTQYMFNNIFYNPAAAGIDTTTNISLLYRNQWTGYQTESGNTGAPVTQILSGYTKFRKLSSGAGGFIMHETIGPYQIINAKLAYAYHLELNAGTLGFGLKGGIYSQRIDASKWDPAVNNDPRLAAFNSQRQADLQPDIGAGIWYQGHKFYGGASVKHLNSPQFFDQSDSSQLVSGLENHAYVTAGYTFYVSTVTKITPSFMYKSDMQSFDASSFDMSALADFYHGKYWGGLAYRQQDAVSLIAGLGLLEDQAMRFSYAVDFTIAGNNAKNGTSHELMVSYVIPVKPPKLRPVIRTPRFRYD